MPEASHRGDEGCHRAPVCSKTGGLSASQSVEEKIMLSKNSADYELIFGAEGNLQMKGSRNKRLTRA